jgi:hypothetical protein
MRQTTESRDRLNRLRVSVNSKERAEITGLAAATGLSVASYLRSCALGYRARNVFDLDAASDMLKVNADLGRLGGLLKMRLSDRPGTGAFEADIRRLLDQIEATALELRGVIARI